MTHPVFLFSCLLLFFVVVVSGNVCGVRAGAPRLQMMNTFVGTARDGLVALPNRASGITVTEAGTGVQIGVPGAGQLVLLSGNLGNGIDVYAPGLKLLNSYIGTDRTGNKALPNQDGVGISIGSSAVSCTIGGRGADSLTVVGAPQH